MSATDFDRDILRRLAARLAEIGSLPVQQERASLIKSLNALKPVRPVVLTFPEGGWNDLLPESELCRDPLLRQWERTLRMKIFYHEEIGSDIPVLGTFAVAPAFVFGDYGVEEHWDRPANRGAAKWVASIKSPEDFAKLRPRKADVDRAETQRRLELANELFGDLINVRLNGQPYWSTGMTKDLVLFRGLDQAMLDLYDNPRLIHQLMAFLRDGRLAELDYFEHQGLLTLNNGPEDYVGSGGLGFTDELPAKDFDGKVRTRDLWALCESQEFVGVGPEQFAEFVLAYQAPVINRFGLACYGCCESLAQKLPLVRKAIPNLRRVSVSAWFDVAEAARQIQDRFVFSWKPNPAMICGPSVDWSAARDAVKRMLEATGGCRREIIMKDTHTFHGDKSRPGRWTRMVRQLIG